MRIVLAIVSVIVFGAVAVIASGARGQLGPPAGPTALPYYTALPAVATVPPDVGDRGARTFARLWGEFTVPLEGGEIPSDPDLMPGAPRDYRAGIHEGIDFPAPSGTVVLAAASGRVVRADTSFSDWTSQQQEIALSEALTLGYTPAATLDRVRGRQVWIDHGKGIVTRYAHLSAVEPLTIGQLVEVGTPIGAVGSSGYPQGGPHLHFEVRIGQDYYGDGLSGDVLMRAVSRLFR